MQITSTTDFKLKGNITGPRNFCVDLIIYIVCITEFKERRLKKVQQWTVGYNPQPVVKLVMTVGAQVLPIF